MAIVIYSKLKDLQIQEKEIYEFGNWLRSFVNKSEWDDEEYVDRDYDDEVEKPINDEGDIMEYPWDSFAYAIIPDSNEDIKSSREIAESLGTYSRYDIQDLSKTFFIVK